MKKSVSAVLVILAGLAVFSAPAADFTGDGLDDIAIFRSATGLWAIRGVTRVYFGSEGDIPVPGKYVFTTRDSIAIFRPSTGLWAVRDGARNYFGTDGDIPVGFGGSDVWTRNGSKIYYNSGSAGIGTVDPNYRLQCHTNSSSHSYISFTNQSTGAGSLDGVLVGIDPAEDFRIHTYENNNIRFYINNSQKAMISSAGRVGIGTGTPAAKLHVIGNDAQPGLIVRGGDSDPPLSCDIATFLNGAGVEQFYFNGSGYAGAKTGFGTWSPYISMHFVPDDQEIEDYQVGDVVSAIDRRAVKTGGAFDRTVVGVICPPEGFISIPKELREEMTTTGKRMNDYPLVPVAYIGNVQVKVNAEGGGIRSGDLIVPSSSPGVAMKGEPETFLQYASVIGKAREDFAGEEGLIWVSLGVK